MFSYLSLVTVLISVVWTQADNGCPPGYTAYGISCYAFVDHKMNWPDAESTCAALGGFLAEIFGPTENSFIQNMSRSHGGHAIWIGGNDLIKEGQWTWARSGVLIKEFSDWYPGQPETSSQDDENCMELNVDHYGGHWNDDECDHDQRFICQRLAESTIIG